MTTGDSLMKQIASDTVADDEIDTLKADAARWKQYIETGLPTAHYNEFDSARKIKIWKIIINGKMYSAETANEAADMLITVRGETP